MSYQGWWDHKERTIPFFIPETMTGCKPHILPLLSTFLAGFKWKEFGFLKNRPLPCLCWLLLVLPFTGPSQKRFPQCSPLQPMVQGRRQQVLQPGPSVNSTRSREKNLSFSVWGWLPAGWASCAGPGAPTPAQRETPPGAFSSKKRNMPVFFHKCVCVYIPIKYMALRKGIFPF